MAHPPLRSRFNVPKQQSVPRPVRRFFGTSPIFGVVALDAFQFAHPPPTQSETPGAKSWRGLVYGTLIAWAEELGHDEIVRLLTTNLNEEKAANTKLNTVALRKGVNAKASTAA
jgi:hypothetical protein